MVKVGRSMRKGKRILLIASMLILSLQSASASLFRHRAAEKSAPENKVQPAEAAPSMTLNAIDIEQSPAPRVVLRTTGAPAYTSYNPTPDSFVVDLTGTTKAPSLSIPSSLPPSLSAIAADEVSEMGAHLTRVTFRLTQPGSLQASAEGNSVTVVLPVSQMAAAMTPAPTAPAPAIAEPRTKAAVMAEPSLLPKATTLKRVDVLGTGDTLQVQLTGDGDFNYKDIVLESPSRIVVDLNGVKNKVARRNMTVVGSVVKRVRIGDFDGHVTRVVLDIDQKTPYRVSKAGQQLLITFGDFASSAPVAETPSAPVTTTSVASGDIPSQVPTVADSATTWKMPASASKGAKAVIRSADQATPPAPRPAAARTPAQMPATPAATPTAGTTDNVFADQQQPAPTGGTVTGGSLTGTRSLTAAERTYTGEPISLNLKDADLKDVLRTFAQLTGLNIAIDPGVTGSVTVDFVDVPWDQALDIILRQNNLSYVLEGNVMRIGTLARLSAEAAATRQLLEEQRLNVPLQTVSFKLSYARAADVQSLLTQIASPRGRIIIDARTNQIIITEIPGSLQTMRNLIESVDVPTRQVLIEARIVDTTKTFRQSYGISWGFQGLLDPALGTGTGLVFPNRVGVVGGPFEFGGPGPVLTFHLGDVLGAFNLDVALNAAEAEGLVRVISAPRVVTQDNTAAQISSGVQIPFQTRVNFTTTISYVDATLNLSVVPQITEAGTVIMDIQVQKNEPAIGLVIEGAAGTPIQTRQARTRLMVRDGGTSVIGGIYSTNDNRASTRIPFLWQIPVIGNLFQNHSIGTNTYTELLIFITPRILRTS